MAFPFDVCIRLARSHHHAGVWTSADAGNHQTKRRRWFAISGVIIALGLISLLFNGLNLGIDFRGGTSWEVPGGHGLGTVGFPETDLAAMARGVGFDAVSVRTVADLDAVGEWIVGPRERPLLVDAKVVADHPSWWLEEAFRGH